MTDNCAGYKSYCNLYNLQWKAPISRIGALENCTGSLRLGFQIADSNLLQYFPSESHFSRLLRICRHKLFTSCAAVGDDEARWSLLGTLHLFSFKSSVSFVHLHLVLRGDWLIVSATSFQHYYPLRSSISLLFNNVVMHREGSASLWVNPYSIAQ